MEEKKKYFLVTAMCGHVGKMRYVPKNFAVKANSASEAAQLAKTFPRVKRHRKDAILSCVEITHEQYLTQRAINRQDRYLNAKCDADLVWDEEFCESVKTIHRKHRKEKRPLSMKYREWKVYGRFFAE